MIYNFDLLKQITADEILEQLSQEDIYSYYLGTRIKANKLNKCCFHKDDTPSLGFYKSSKYINFKCFGCGKNGNVFQFVAELNNTNFYESLKIISNDFGLSNKQVLQKSKKEITGNYVENLFEETKRVQIFPTYRNFEKIDYDIWNPYYIPLHMLYDYDVRATSVVYYTNKLGEYKQYCSHHYKNPIYTYIFDEESFKIYRPNNPDKIGKWFTNATNYHLQGMKQLSEHRELLIITSSLKDVMVLKILGYEAVAPQGEGMNIPDSIMNYLWATSDNIVVFYDNDKAGLKAGLELSESIGAGNMYIPTKYKVKDISDFIRMYGDIKAKELLNKLL